MFGLKNNVACFNWYVPFYLFVLVTLPLLEKIMNLSNYHAILCYLAPTLFGRILTLFVDEENLMLAVIRNIYNFYPCVIIGWVFAKNNVFAIFDKTISTITKNKYIQLILYVIILSMSFLGRYFVKNFDLLYYSFLENQLSLKINLDVVYAPLFIWSFISIYRFFDIKIKILQILGVYSTNIWFLHCIFFNQGSMALRELLYKANNPVVVLLLAILLCLLISFIINKPISMLNSKIDSLFTKINYEKAK